MSVSSVSSTVAQLTALLASQNSGTTSSTSNSKTDSTLTDLSTAVSNAMSTGDGTASALYSALVTLSSANGSDSSSTTTYNAKGLLNEVKRSLMENNPLYGTDNSSSDVSSFFETNTDTNSSALSTQLNALIEEGLKNISTAQK
ncbi:MAG: hypothetical protein H6R19_238 [Proteobacteria bacterium]|nr:hypothetical protein [Pseudomonadota bacterium]